MKNKIVVLSFVLSLTALAMSFYAARQTGPIERKNDYSAYDRVMAKNEIVCGIYPWAPAKTIDPTTKEWTGWAVDVYRRSFATLDLNVKFKEVVIGNQVQDLNSGIIDAICDDGPWTMSSGKFVAYSDPIMYAPVYPYVRINETRFKTRASLNNKDVRFIGIDGDLSNDLVGRLFPDTTLMSLPGTTDVSQLYLNVAGGKADIAIGDPEAFRGYEKHNPNKLRPLFQENPLGKYKVVISVKMGDSKMLSLVNQAVDNAITFGIVDDILSRVDPKHERILPVRDRAALLFEDGKTRTK